MPRPTILTFSLPADRLAKVRMVCMRLGVLVRPVAQAELTQPIGVLCGAAAPVAPDLPGAPVAPMAPDLPAALSEPMLLFAHMSSAQVQRFLQTARQMRAPSIALKAILTPTNAAWTPVQLAAELSQERAAILAGQQAHEGE